jgi:hypothetical protein
MNIKYYWYRLLQVLHIDKKDHDMPAGAEI